jgi:Papain family cysteine protease
MNIDWRNRFGRSWITSVRDQGGSNNCWAFAATALYEAMIRIEHVLWTRRSEGDLARGTGKQSWDLGNLGEATIFVERYGLADPDCFPWGAGAALYTAKPHGASLQATPISPTPDRSGRTMRIGRGAGTGLSDVAQKKTWIDLVGPMATIVSPPADFGSFHGSGVYTPTTTVIGGAHALLVVGFNDDEGYWIVKNSYGTGWGEGGFAKVAYAAGFLDTAMFLGVHAQPNNGPADADAIAALVNQVWAAWLPKTKLLPPIVAGDFNGDPALSNVNVVVTEGVDFVLSGNPSAYASVYAPEAESATHPSRTPHDGTGTAREYCGTVATVLSDHCALFTQFLPSD